MNVTKNNPVQSAKKAKFMSDIDTLKTELELYISKKLVDTVGGYNRVGLNATKDKVVETKDKAGNTKQSTIQKKTNAITYSITYNTNGESTAPASQTKIHGINISLSSTVPTKGGYKFLGWSESASATEATYTAGVTIKFNFSLRSNFGGGSCTIYFGTDNFTYTSSTIQEYTTKEEGIFSIGVGAGKDSSMNGSYAEASATIISIVDVNTGTVIPFK